MNKAANRLSIFELRNESKNLEIKIESNNRTSLQTKKSDKFKKNPRSASNEIFESELKARTALPGSTHFVPLANKPRWLREHLKILSIRPDHEQVAGATLCEGHCLVDESRKDPLPDKQKARSPGRENPVGREAICLAGYFYKQCTL